MSSSQPTCWPQTWKPIRMLTTTARGSAARRRRGSGPMAPAPWCPEGVPGARATRACRRRARAGRRGPVGAAASGPGQVDRRGVGGHRGRERRADRVGAPAAPRDPARALDVDAMAEGQVPRRWVGGLGGHHRAVHDELEVGDDVLRRPGGQLDLQGGRAGDLDRVAGAVTVDRQLDQRARRHEGAPPPHGVGPGIERRGRRRPRVAPTCGSGRVARSRSSCPCPRRSAAGSRRRGSGTTRGSADSRACRRSTASRGRRAAPRRCPRRSRPSAGGSGRRSRARPAPGSAAASRPSDA